MAIVDQLLRNRIDPARLDNIVMSLTGPDTARIRSVLTVADPGAESVMESWLRCLIIDAGLPRPESQVPVRTSFGTSFLDLGYSRLRLGIEYDGVKHHCTPAGRGRDAIRRKALADAGWHVEIVTVDELMNETEAMIHRIHSALRNLGWAGRPRVTERAAYLDMFFRRQREAWRM